MKKRWGASVKWIPADCSAKMDSCTHHKDSNASEDGNVFMIKTKGSSNAKPVIMIDGEIQNEGYDMEAISPDDIARINVLKGPSAIEKVGERGANGVIMIELKKN